MVRPIGMLAGAGFVLVLLWSLVWGVIAYVPEIGKPTVLNTFELPKHPKENVSWSFEGVGGTYDNRQLQRGFQVYKEVCSACHSLKQVAFRDLEEIGFNKAEVKAIAKGWTTEVPSINPETGEPTTRKATARSVSRRRWARLRRMPRSRSAPRPMWSRKRSARQRPIS